MEDQSLDERVSAVAGNLAESLRTEPDRFPFSAWRQMGEAGLIGIAVPREMGGAGAGWRGAAEVAAAMMRETGNIGVTMAWLIEALVAGHYLAGFADESQRRRWLEPLLSGRLLAAVATSEPEVGANPKHLQTTARGDGGGWRLSGRKAFVTNGPDAELFVVLAVSATVQGRKSFSTFLVPRDSRGLTVVSGREMPMLQPVRHAELELADCRLPAEALLGPPGQALERMAKPFRLLEDRLGPAIAAGGFERLRRLGLAECRAAGMTPSPTVLEGLGRFKALNGLLTDQVRALAGREIDDPAAPAALVALQTLEALVAREAEGWMKAAGLADRGEARGLGQRMKALSGFAVRRAAFGAHRYGKAIFENEV